MFVALATVFVVSVVLFPGIIFLRPDYIIAALSLILGIVFTSRADVRIVSLEVSVFVALVVSAVLSIFAQVVSGNGFLLRDLMIVFRYGYYIAVLLFGVALAYRVFPLRWLVALWAIITTFVVVLSVVQYWNVGGINSVLVPIYSTKNEILISGASWRRTIGTAGNPNYWGLWVALLLLSYCYLMFWKGRLLAIVPASLLFLALILTGSRTALVATVAGCVLGGAFIALFSRSPPKAWAVLLVLGMGGIAFVSSSIQESYEYQGRYSLENIKTLETRLQHWAGIFDKSLSSTLGMFIGEGPAKSEGARWGDNMYIVLFRDFGMLGLALYVTLQVVMLRRLSKVYSETIGAGRLLSGWLIIAVIARLVFDLAADSWYDVRITAMLLLLYGMVVAGHARDIFRSSELQTKRDVFREHDSSTVARHPGASALAGSQE